MRILLLGEYSRLHNSLKAGLTSLDCDVTLVGDGDGFKGFPADISIEPKFFNKTIFKYVKLAVYKITGWDLTNLERGSRFHANLNKLKGYDVVQLINERPIKTISRWERYLLKRLVNQNKCIVLVSCGADYANIKYATENKEEDSLITPYFKNPSLKPQFSFALEYLKNSNRKTHELVYDNIDAVVASDFDYVSPLKKHSIFKGLFPNPVIVHENNLELKLKEDKIKIFLGINRWNYHAKGLSYFEKALSIIEDKYPSKVIIIKTENLPYKKYMELLGSSHIVLDQVYSKDQGYNALESMAMGKVVFTGANSEFLNHYNLEEDEVCIDAKPDVNYLVKKLSSLIENSEKMEEIGANARRFVEKEHHYVEVAKKYLSLYQSLT